MGLEGIDITNVIDFTLKMVTELDLNAKAGTVYYLRYSEVDKDAAKFKDMTFHQNPLQVVTPEVAMAEIQETKMLDSGRGLIASIDKTKAKEIAIAEEAIEETREAEEEEDSAPKSWNPF
jgi:hypothetical protein